MRKIEKLFGLLFLLFCVFGVPVHGKAMSILPYEDKDLPEVKGLYVRFVDHEGKTFPNELSLEAREIRSSYAPAGSSIIGQDLDDEPVVFTTANQSNIFYFDRTGNEYRKLRSIGYQKGIADWKLTSPVRYVKYFSTTVPPGVTPLPDLHGVFSNSTVHDMTSSWRYTNDDFSIWRRTNYIWMQALWEEQPDGTYLQTMGRKIGKQKRMISELGYSHIVVNENASGVKALGSYYGVDGEGMTLYAYNKEIQEIFEDETGALITPPTGYTNGKYTEITSDPFVYNMEDGDKLPSGYSIGNQFYKYQGWYKGANNQSQLNRDFPPNITFDAAFDEKKDEVHIVYKKALPETLTEKYLDEKGAVIDSTWDRVLFVEKDAEYTFTPEIRKTDTASAEWAYEGWKLSTDPTGTKRTTPVSLPMKGPTEVHYLYTKVQHTITESWVNENDKTELLAIPSNPSTGTKVASNDAYNYTPQEKIMDDSGGSWKYTGWENATTEPGTIHPASDSVLINKVQTDYELRYYYTREQAAAEWTLTPTPQIVEDGEQVLWTVKLTNTGPSLLKELILKAEHWSTGLSVPSQLTVSDAKGNSKDYPVTASDWINGLALTDITIAAGQDSFVLITFETTATGAANQILQGELEMAGNIPAPLKTDSFVRIDDPDEPNINPSGDDGLLNIPNFYFGTVNTSPSPQTKNLDSEAYQRPDYQPYIRYKIESGLQGNWELGLELGPFTADTDILTEETSVSLKNGVLKKVDAFNQETESLVPVGAIGDQTVCSDNTSVALTAGNTTGIYQIDYKLSDIEINLLSTTGVAVNSGYQAKLNWSLSTGP